MDPSRFLSLSYILGFILGRIWRFLTLGLSIFSPPIDT